MTSQLDQLDSVSTKPRSQKAGALRGQLRSPDSDKLRAFERKLRPAKETTGACSSRRPPAGLLTNPHSFYNRRRPEPVMREILRDYPEVHKFPVRNREEIRTAVQQLKDIDAKLIIANGGDGTVQGVITEVWHAWGGRNLPQLAVMPGGRTNVISYDLNGRERPREVLKSILKTYCQTESAPKIKRNLMHIRCNGEPVELGFLISAAGLAGGIEQCWSFRHRYKQLGLFGGMGTAAWVIRRLLGTPAGKPLLQPRAARVIIDGEQIPSEQQQIVMVTVNQKFPIGINPFWKQRSTVSGEARDTESGALRVTVIPAKTKGLWWRSIPLALGWSRFLPEHAGYFSRCADRVQIHTDESFHLDGESWAMDHPQLLDITVGPELEFVTR